MLSNKTCNDIFVLMIFFNKSIYSIPLNFLALFTNIIYLILLEYGIKTVLNIFTYI